MSRNPAYRSVASRQPKKKNDTGDLSFSAACAGDGAALFSADAAFLAALAGFGVLAYGADGAVGLHHALLSEHSSWVAQSAGALISAALLWDVLFRGQLGVSVMFFEEMYARNLGQLFAAPLRPLELAAALICMSLLRTLFSFSASSLLAWVFYGHDLLRLGLPLVGLFFNLILMSWGVGLAVAGLVLRWGLGAEGIAWAAIFILAPLSGVYYPVEILPGWLQQISLALPSTHVFAGMREILIADVFDPRHLYTALLLNVGFLGAGVCVFLAFFRSARQRGLLLRVGE